MLKNKRRSPQAWFDSPPRLRRPLAHDPADFNHALLVDGPRVRARRHRPHPGTPLPTGDEDAANDR